VDFFNEVSLIWGIISEGDLPQLGAGEGFPPGFEYRWADGVRIKQAIKCSSTQYVEYVMSWIEEQINNEAIFPTTSGKAISIHFSKYFALTYEVVKNLHFQRIIWP